MNTKKRLVVNTAAALLIIGVAVLASLSYEPLSKNVGNIEPPALATLKVVDVLSPKPSLVALALRIPEKSGGDLVSDILETYRWARAKFPSVIKCGKEYPGELCDYGVVVIFLVSSTHEEIPLVHSTDQGYDKVALLILDQTQIDKLLAKIPPETMQEVLEFHQKVAQETEGTGGGVKVYNDLSIFGGLILELESLGLITP